jgi:hypothetical protein
MSKKPTRPKLLFEVDLKNPDLVLEVDPNRTHPPINQDVKLPQQVRLALERIGDLIAGKQPQPVEVTRAKAEKSIPYTDAQIDAVLERWDQGKLSVSDPEFGILVALAREGARHIKARRRGAQKPREKSEAVTRRGEALLQAFRELPPKGQRYPTGAKTIERLRKAVIQKLGLPDNDDGLSEDMIRQCIRELRPLIRLVQKGKMPPPGEPRPEVAERIRRQAAGNAAANRFPEPPEPPEPPIGPSDDC